MAPTPALPDKAVINEMGMVTHLERFVCDDRYSHENVGIAIRCQWPAIRAALLAAAPAMQEWQPIETHPGGEKPCWIGHAYSETMLVAYQSKVMPGTWHILWSDRIVPWLPSHWMPLPSPPQAKDGTATPKGSKS